MTIDDRERFEEDEDYYDDPWSDAHESARNNGFFAQREISHANCNYYTVSRVSELFDRIRRRLQE